MSAVLVDSNVLLDLVTDDSDWSEWSAVALETVADRNRLVINPIIYTEVSVRFTNIETLEAKLPRSLLDRESILNDDRILQMLQHDPAVGLP